MALEPRSANQPFLTRESRLLTSEGATKPKIQLNHDYVRSVITSLNRDAGLWREDLPAAMIKVLKVCIASMGCQVASIWRLDPVAQRLNCLAQYEAGLGAVVSEVDTAGIDGNSFLSSFLNTAIVCINDCLSDDRVSEAVDPYFSKHNVKSLLTATIYQQGSAAGLLVFESLGETKHFSDVEQMLAANIADLSSRLILSSEMARQQSILRLLDRITKISAGELTPEQLVEYLMEQLHLLAPSAWIGFYQMHSDNEANLVCAVGEGMPDYVKTAIGDVEIEGAIHQALVEDDNVYVIRDCTTWDEPINLPVVDIAVALGFESIAFVPLSHGRDLLGFVQVWTKDRSFNFDDRQQLYRSLGSTFAVTYANATSIRDLRHDISHDGLTGLSNEDQLFVDFINIDGRKPHLLLLVQLAEFNQVHEALGRERADEVLKVTASRLLQFAADKHDTKVYRLSRTEFCMMVTNPLGINGIAQEILDCLLPPVDIDGLSLVLQPVIGMSLTPDHGNQCEVLLQNLDKAVNVAKHKNCSHFLYEPDSGQMLHEDQRLIEDLKVALSDDQLILYYQPEFELGSNELVACEALLRWQHPELGFISPNKVIKLAEAAGLMRSLTQWIVKQTISQVSIFQLMELNIKVSINISPLDLVDNTLPTMIQNTLSEFGVEASCLRLEVSESALMNDFKLARKSLRSLGDIGVLIDIDNFGLGFSSIANLYELPLSSIKIDRYFVNDICVNKSHEAVVRSIIGMGHGLGVRIIGEGVEDSQTVDKLRDLGCDMAQGYCFGRPVPAAEFIAEAGTEAGV